MPQIVYQGPHALVSVPAHQLADVEHGVPIDVPEHVAADLTLGGLSPVWLALDRKGVPIQPPAPPAPPTEPDGIPVPAAGADENTEA